jgi:hypothetical protein
MHGSSRKMILASLAMAMPTATNFLELSHSLFTGVLISSSENSYNIGSN